jgi:hypothetical protein
MQVNRAIHGYLETGKMNIDDLIKEFENFDTGILAKYLDLISSKYNGIIFPPYVPHIGSNYGKYRLLMYGMAQSIVKPWDALLKKNKVEKIKQLYEAGSYDNIWIGPYRVMLAVAGIYIYAKYRDLIFPFNDIHNSIAVTNYYKFSFSSNGKDINPDNALSRYHSPELYWDENDKLVKKELDVLMPSIIISFNGRHVNQIIKRGFRIQKINDPSWILQGGGGVLSTSGSWYREIHDGNVYKLVDSYLNQIYGKYKSKKEAIKIYLLKYYCDWSN